MKIAISADGSTLNANVAHRLGTAEYMLIVDLDTGDVEALPNPGNSRQQGAGIQAIVLAVNKGVDAVLTGFCNPNISHQFEKGGIKIITGINGTAMEALKTYKSTQLKGTSASLNQSLPKTSKIGKDALLHAAANALRQLVNMLPIMIGIVLLIGLFNTFITKKMLANVFSGNPGIDIFLGACFGSVFTGNPINSYIIGGELLKYGVSATTVTAFMIAWVTVGLIQLPAESAALGRRFAFIRNIVSFFMAIIVAIFTISFLNFAGIVL